MPLPMAPDAPSKQAVRAAEAAAAKTPVEEEQDRLRVSLRDIKHKIGIHSGKGGVGKTFLACNIAMLLAAEGYETGLLDADIDCPNVHTFLGLNKSMEVNEDEKLLPVLYRNVKIVSTGFLQNDGEPLIIRGPIKHRVLMDFLEKTTWGPLDYLVIDFPPGTSDVPLSAMQFADLSGVIFITTPQKESVLDVTRAVTMARSLGIPIIGIVENMSGEIFGNIGKALAEKLEIPFLGEIPLSREIRELSENGEAALLATDTIEHTASQILAALSNIKKP